MCILSKSAQLRQPMWNSEAITLLIKSLFCEKTSQREREKQIIPKMGKKLPGCRSLQHDSSVELFNSFFRPSKIVTPSEKEPQLKKIISQKLDEFFCACSRDLFEQVALPQLSFKKPL